MKESRTASDTAWGLLSACVGIAGGVASFAGLRWAGEPTELVSHYNQTHR